MLKKLGRAAPCCSPAETSGLVVDRLAISARQRSPCELVEFGWDWLYGKIKACSRNEVSTHFVFNMASDDIVE